MRSPASQEVLPIQPVEKPIICKPYQEPTAYWHYGEDGLAHKAPGRRPAGYYFKDKRTGSDQTSLFVEENRDDLPIVNALREDVRWWRENDYVGATHITRELLRHWRREDRTRRLFFCQLEAAETIIFLNEVRYRRPDGSRHRPRANKQFEFQDFDFVKLVDVPNEADLSPLTRYGCKMATGSGKTVVMSMLIAWAFCNRGQVSSDERFPRAALICAPNLTVKERLQVLRPDIAGNYYEAFDIVPFKLRPLMQSGKVLIENWHKFAPESEHAEGGKSYPVVNKGEESPEAFARRVLGDLYESAPIMVLNDEAHHAYRPKPLEEGATQGKGIKAVALTAEQKSEREEATVWIAGLDRLNTGCGVRFCVDLSATPFYLAGSGYMEGAPFTWLVSDFGLVDAIESGIVKIPRLPVASNDGRADPKYFRLWQEMMKDLVPAQKIGRKPKPEIAYQKAEGALLTLASQYKERFDYIQAATDGQEKVPPVMILVCDNTDIAEEFYERISGEHQEDDTEGIVTLDEDEEEAEAAKGKRIKKKTVYGDGSVFPELFSNTEEHRRTVRIDTKLLAQAESAEGGNRQDAAQQLRHIIATVGKKGEAGEQVRCVVSVSMLTEGWDANNVTHIFGLRPFESQLLCEQVVGRGLRRMDYTVDPETGLLTEEYVDIYGIPFSLIPYKGRETGATAPVDKPKNHVFAVPERKGFEIKFPIVEGYAFALNRNYIRADVSKIQRIEVSASTEPTAVFVRPQVGYQDGRPSIDAPGESELQTRASFYENTHLQQIEFEITRRVVNMLTEGVETQRPKMKLTARHQLFPQVFRIVHQYVNTRINFKANDPRELGLYIYAKQVIDLLFNAIEPDEDAGEPPLVPILNRYKPFGSTSDVNFKTTRPVYGTVRSHINQVSLDTVTWERSAAFTLDNSKWVECYARNERLGFLIPYEFSGVSHAYEPDFLVRLVDKRMLILETKGYEPNQDKAKHQAAQRWVSAVNNSDKMGVWKFHVCHDPDVLNQALEYFVN